MVKNLDQKNSQNEVLSFLEETSDGLSELQSRDHEAEEEFMEHDDSSCAKPDPYDELHQRFYRKDWMEDYIHVLVKTIVFERYDPSFIAAVKQSTESFLASASTEDQGHLAWASFFGSLKEVPKAIQELSAITNPNFAVIGYLYYRLAVLARQASQQELAQACIQYTQQYYPDFTPVVMEQGLAELEQGNRDQAMAHFRTAIADPLIKSYTFFTVLVQRGLDDMVDACVDYHLELHPDDLGVVTDLADIYEERECFDRAIHFWDLSWEHDPRDHCPEEPFDRLAQKKLQAMGLGQILTSIGENWFKSQAFWMAVRERYGKEEKNNVVQKIDEILKIGC